MTSDTITLFEHQYRSFDDLDLFLQDFARREHVLEQIERMNQIQGKEIVRVERKGLRATQHVGMIKVGETTIQILPKIDYIAANTSTAEPFHSAARSAARNLLMMLSYSDDLHLHEKPSQN